MTLVINTLKDNICNKQIQSLLGNEIKWFDILNTASKNLNGLLVQNAIRG